MKCISSVFMVKLEKKNIYFKVACTYKFRTLKVQSVSMQTTQEFDQLELYCSFLAHLSYAQDEL